VAPLLAQVLAVDDAGKRGLPLGAVEVRFDLVGRLGADVADAQPCQQAIFALQPAVQSRRWLGHRRIGHTRTQRGAERHLRIFDGQLARSDLDGVYVMAQVSYIVVAALAVAAAIGRIWAIQRGRVHSSVSDVRM
jgi:hypothetical protein